MSVSKFFVVGSVTPPHDLYCILSLSSLLSPLSSLSFPCLLCVCGRPILSRFATFYLSLPRPFSPLHVQSDALPFRVSHEIPNDFTHGLTAPGLLCLFLSLSLPLCLSVCLSFSLSVCLSVCLSISLSVCFSVVCLSVCLLSIYIYIYILCAYSFQIMNPLPYFLLFFYLFPYPPPSPQYCLRVRNLSATMLRA